MLTQLKGDIFASTCEAIVCPCNTVGVMGAGLAFQFKKHYPAMYTEYNRKCRAGELAIGQVHCWKAPDGPLIINFPTKLHYRNPSKIEYIEQGLMALAAAIKEHGIKSIAIPALGCGLGGLKFGTVLAILKGFSNKLDGVEVVVFEP